MQKFIKNEKCFNDFGTNWYGKCFNNLETEGVLDKQSNLEVFKIGYNLCKNTRKDLNFL